MTVETGERKFEEMSLAVAAELRCLPDSVAFEKSIVAQHLRTAIYVGSTRTTSSESGGHTSTQRLMANLRRSLDGFFINLQLSSSSSEAQAANGDLYRTTLDCIAGLGDVVDVGGGHWISAPLRLVEMDGAEALLVVGGYPMEAARAALGLEMASGGIGRFTVGAKSSAKLRNSEIVVPLASWLGVSEVLSVWTSRATNSHLKRLSHTDEIAADQVELYAPDILRNQHKKGRWVQATQIHQSIDGPRLFRPLGSRSRDYSRPYYLGLFDVRDGELVLLRSAPVEFEVSLRLRFGIDELLKTPRSVKISVQGDTCTVTPWLKLPEPENRIRFLGWTSQPHADRNPEIVTFHRSSVPMLIEIFRRLAIQTSIAGTGTMV